jgi:hypothetical protein
VNEREQYARISATPKAISLVGDDCATSPFTRVVSASACGSGDLVGRDHDRAQRAELSGVAGQ